MRKSLLLFLAVLLTGGVAAAQTGTPAAGSVEVSDAWARATPGQAETGAAYLTIAAPSADRLAGLSTPVAAKAELHEMTMQAGIMQMRPLAGLEIPAGHPVVLKPGGVHIMLTGLKAPLRAGQSFPLTLQFDKAGRREVKVAVEKAGAMGPPHASAVPSAGPSAAPSAAGRQ